MWELFYYAAVFFLLAWSLFTPSGRNAWGWFWNNLVASAFLQIQPLLKELGPDLAAIVTAFTEAVSTTGPSLVKTVAAPLGAFAASSIGTVIGNLEGITES